jgi:hypothetical protein
MQPLDKLRIIWRNSLENASIREFAAELIAGNRHGTDILAFDLGQKLRVGNLIRPGTLPRILEQVEQCDQQQADDDPDREIAEI